MKEKFTHFLLLIDIFGTHPRFTINGEKTFNTYFGCFITLICSGIITLFFIIYTKDVINHSRPKLLTSIYNDGTSSKTLVTGKDFIITLSLQFQNYSNYINDKIYNIEAGIYINKDNIESRKQLELIKCSEYKFEIIPEYFKNLDLNNLYCLKNSTFEIQGEYQSDIFEYLYFKFSICKNSTENNNKCESKELIESTLSGGYIGIFMSDKSVIPNNFSIPYETYGKNLFTTFTYKQYLDYWIYFKNMEVYTDKGYFFISTDKNSFISYENFESYIDYRENDAFALIGLRKSNKREVYERSYTKIQEAAANAGGIVKIITLIGKFIVYFFRQILYRNFLIQFFKFKNNRAIIPQKYPSNYSYNISPKLNLSPIKNILNLKKRKNNDNNINSTPKFHITKNYMKKNKNNNSFNSITSQINNLNNSNNNLNYPNFSSLFKEFQLKSPKKKNSGISVISALNNLIKTNTFEKKVIRVNPSRNCLPLIFNKNCISKIKNINHNFSKVDFLFDIVQYFKILFEVKLLKNKVLDEEQRFKLNKMFKFNYDFYAEKEGFDFFYKKKNEGENSIKSNQIKRVPNIFNN